VKPVIPLLNMPENNTVTIALGSNIGDRQKNLANAKKQIKKFVTIEKKSSIYETDPVDYENQDKFLNQVIIGKTKYSPQETLKKLQTIEKKMGRIKKITKGPRIIDLDILFFNSETLNTKNLIIPHPEIQNRRFILKPLTEISPNFIHPTLKKSIKELFNNLQSYKKVKIWT